MQPTREALLRLRLAPNIDQPDASRSRGLPATARFAPIARPVVPARDHAAFAAWQFGRRWAVAPPSEIGDPVRLTPFSKARRVQEKASPRADRLGRGEAGIAKSLPPVRLPPSEGSGFHSVMPLAHKLT